jgi:AAA domain
MMTQTTIPAHTTHGPSPHPRRRRRRSSLAIRSRQAQAASTGRSLPDDPASLPSLPLAFAGKAKQHAAINAASLPHQRPKEGKAATQPDPARFSLPTSPKARKQWRLRPLTAKEILRHKAVTTPRRWIVDKLIPEHALVEFTAFMKLGKSTFIYELAVAIARGTPFLDYPTQKGRVLILCVEEDQRDAMQRLVQKLGLRTTDKVRLWPAAVKPWMLPKILRYVNTHDVKLVILDTLSRYWQQPEVKLSDENDNLGAGRAVAPFLNLARRNTSGAAVVLVHHDRKEGGADGESGRGASSPYGLVDQNFRLRKAAKPSQRRLGITGRYDVTPRALLLDYVPNGLPPVKMDGEWVKPRHYVNLGTPKEVTPVSHDDQVLAGLTTEWARIETVMQRTELPRKPLDEALKRLLANGLASRRRVGKRYLYKKTAVSASMKNGGSR